MNSNENHEAMEAAVWLGDGWLRQCEAETPSIGIQIYHVLTRCPWASYLTSPTLLWKMKVIMVFTS